jgi:hypothetical protein
MSKINLTPNASGTGVFTIASPNSNTNRTLNLPDEAGEFVLSASGVISNFTSTGIDDNATSTAVTLDASGRVGISTATFDNAAQVLVAKGDASVSTSDADNSGFNFTAVPDTTTGKVGIGLKTYNETASAVAALYATPVSQYRNSLTARYNADSGGGYFSIEQLVPEAASVQERMRIDASGRLLIGKTSTGISTVGTTLGGGGYAEFTRAADDVILINRTINDGKLVRFFQDGTEEGAISISGTTVTYGGGHLARWSQSDTDDVSSLYKGTVMSNLDEMCEWDNEDNEQLNKTKVSDVESDVNVAGVFVAEDNSDGFSDYWLAMTGDMIIRIAQGTTVQRGDLLISAGDGTAKPQDDDIVRSKTIAKVTSTNVTCTYADGSYCVPCVLMAC